MLGELSVKNHPSPGIHCWPLSQRGFGATGLLVWCGSPHLIQKPLTVHPEFSRLSWAWDQFLQAVDLPAWSKVVLHQTWGCMCSSRLDLCFLGKLWTDLKWVDLGAFHSPDFPNCSQNHTSEKYRHSPGDSCPSVWSTNPSHLLCSSLGKILKVLKCETKRVSTFIPARKHSRGVEFVFPIRLHAARPLPSPSQVGLINGLLSQHNEVQRGVRLLGHSPNSFCRRITFGSLCTIKQRTCGSLIYQVGSEDDYFSSSRYTQHALIAEAKQGIWGIQTLFTFRWNWISELYTKLGKGVSDQDGGEDRLLYRVTDRLI